MTEPEQEIPVIHGFVQIFFGDLAVPTEAMLIEMLYPGTDTNNAKIVVYQLVEAAKIPHLGSQLLLQYHSNFIVSSLVDNDLGLTSSVAKHHNAVSLYIAYFYYQMPPTSKKAGDLLKQIRMIQLEAKKLLDKGVDDVRAIQEKVKTAYPALLGAIEASEERLLLEQRFPDYRAAVRFISDATNSRVEPQLFGTRIDEKRLAQKRATNRKEKPENPTLIFQCLFCGLWFEQKIGNGKRRQKCQDCFKTWDRNRRKNLGSQE
jgi:hypothetical protein